MTSAVMDVFFHPRKIAVIGASSTPGKIGYLLMQALVDAGYPGDVVPVNSSGSGVLGYAGARSIAEVDGGADLAITLVPADVTLSVVDQCVRAGVKAIVILSSGFGEAGGSGTSMQTAIADRCRGSGTRVIGPNCVGITDLGQRLVLNFSPAFRGMKKVGRASMASQSGGYLSATVRELAAAGMGLAKSVSTGNEVDVKAVDVMEYYAEDAATGIIVAYLEQIRDPRRFMDVMPNITKRKPVVISKTGRSDVGIRAAATHTGALAGSAQVAMGAFRQVGVLQAHSFDDMIAMTIGLGVFDGSGTSRPLVSDRIAILSQAGGFLVEMADLSREAGFVLAPLGPMTQRFLREMVPSYGTTSNPVDFTAALMSNPTWVGRAIHEVAKDDQIDGLVVVLTAMAPGEGISALASAIRLSSKPVLIVWPGGEHTSPDALRELHELGIPTCRTPRTGIVALTALRTYSRIRA